MGSSTIFSCLPLSRRMVFKCLQVFLQDVVILVVFIFFDNGNHGILIYKAGNIINMTIGIIANNTITNHNTCSTP